MPFGKYKGTLLCDMPVHYLEWLKNKGFPPGKLGMLLSSVYEIKRMILRSNDESGQPGQLCLRMLMKIISFKP